MWKHLGAVHPCCHIKTKVTDDTLLLQFGSLQNIWQTTHILTLFQHIWSRWKWEMMLMDRSSWFRCNDATVFNMNTWNFYGGRSDVLPMSHTADWMTAAENNSVMDQSPAKRTWLTTEQKNLHVWQISISVLTMYLKKEIQIFSAASPSWQTGKCKSLQSFYFGQEYDVKVWLIGEMTHDRFCIKMARWQVVSISCTFINCGKMGISDSGCMLMSEQCLMTHCSNNGTLLIEICVQPPPQQHWLATGSSISTNTLQKKILFGNGVKTM